MTLISAFVGALTQWIHLHGKLTERHGMCNRESILRSILFFRAKTRNIFFVGNFVSIPRVVDWMTEMLHYQNLRIHPVSSGCLFVPWIRNGRGDKLVDVVLLWVQMKRNIFSRSEIQCSEVNFDFDGCSGTRALIGVEAGGHDEG